MMQALQHTSLCRVDAWQLLTGRRHKHSHIRSWLAEKELVMFVIKPWQSEC